MIPGLADQIRMAIEESVRAVLLEKGIERAATIAHECGRNAAQSVVFVVESVTEELADARSIINEAAKALDALGVDGAGDLAERIRRLGAMSDHAVRHAGTGTDGPG